MTQREYLRDNGRDQLILDDDVIEEMITNGENLNMTGHCRGEIASSTPLTYAIFTNNKKLFMKIIHAGADINYKMEKFELSAIHYSLDYHDDFFIEELMKTNKLDIYSKITIGQNENPLEYVLSRQFLCLTIDDKEMFSRLKKYIKYIDSRKDFDFEKFFNQNSIFRKAYESEERFKFIINHFPKKWLHNHINFYNGSEVEAEVLLRIFNVFKVGKRETAKVLNEVSVNRLYDQDNTLLHYYVLKNSPLINKHGINYLDNKVVLQLLNIGFDPKLKNKMGKSVDEQLQEKLFYKEYLIKKAYNKLEETLKVKEEPTKRMKI